MAAGAAAIVRCLPRPFVPPSGGAEVGGRPQDESATDYADVGAYFDRGIGATPSARPAQLPLPGDLLQQLVTAHQVFVARQRQQDSKWCHRVFYKMRLHGRRC